MSNVLREELNKEDLMRYVGDTNQVFGIRKIEYSGGKENLVKAYEVNNGGGLRFSVNENKGLDIFDMSYRGTNLSFVSKAGLNSPYLADEQGMAYRCCLGAGFLYTAGLSNVGGFCEEKEAYHYAHGSMKNIPAENVSARTVWEGRECRLTVEGQMRESAFFGRNLLLHRRIETMAGSSAIHIHDSIENQDFEPAKLMLLYHMNIGFPLLDEGAELLADVTQSEVLSEHTASHDMDYRIMTAPQDGNEEYLYAHILKKNADGTAAAGIFNKKKNLGLYIRYDVEILKYLIEWKCMRSGDYALGILPSTCRPVGRNKAMENGDIIELKPFEKAELDLEIGITEDKEELLCLMEKGEGK